MSPPAARDSVSTPSGRYLLLDHTADLRVRLYAPTPQTLYCTAIEALFSILTDGASLVPNAPLESIEISLDGTDPPDLLIQLLNEALYHRERTGSVPAGLEAVNASNTNLDAFLRLVAFTDPESLFDIKAATYSELRWEVVADGLIAELTLDL